MAENIVFPNNSRLIIPRNFTANGQNFTASINPRTGQPFNIDNTGTVDVTEEFRDFLNCHRNYGANSINYLPNGTYLVSKTLYWAGYIFINGIPYINVDTTIGSATVTIFSDTFVNVNIGDPVEGTGIHPGTTVIAKTGTRNITLSQPVWARISEGGRQKYQILQGQNRELTRIKLVDNLGESFTGAVINTGRTPAQRFANCIRNLTIDIGSGNPKAIGLQFVANNQGIASDLDIISSDPERVGYAGLDLRIIDNNSPFLIKNLKVTGFDYGILTDDGYGETFYNILVQHQRIYGIRNGTNLFAATVFFENLESINSVPAYHSVPTTEHVACHALINCKFHNNGNPTTATALITNSKAFYSRGLTIEDYETSISNSYDGTNLKGDIENYEYYTGNKTRQVPDLGVADNLTLPIEQVPFIPWEQDFSKWISILDVGGAISNTVDQSSFVQTAIDTPGKTVLYFPRGFYRVDQPVYIRGDIQRIVGCEASLDGANGKFILVDGTSDVVIIERLRGLPGGQIQHLSSRTLVLSALTSTTDGVRTYTNIDYKNMVVGTGKVFFEDVCLDSAELSGNKGWFRQYNVESGKSPDKLNVKNHAEVFILGMKTEKSPTCIRLENNAKLEVSGFFYATSGGDPTKIEPIAEVVDSEISLTMTESVTNGKPYLANLIYERAGNIKILHKESEGVYGESHPLITTRRSPSSDIDIKDISPSFVNLTIENGSIVVGDDLNAWNASLAPEYQTQQIAVEFHLGDFRDSKIQYNRFNGMLSIWNNKARNILIQNNEFDFEKADSNGYCIGLHDTYLKVSNNIFKNYGYAFNNILNIIPGAYVSNENMPGATINNNIFCKPYLNAVARFSAFKFAGFPFNFYNNTVIVNNVHQAFLFTLGFNNSSAIASTTEATNIYSRFINNIFYCQSGNAITGLTANNNITISNNAFQNVSVVGSNAYSGQINFESSAPNTSIWEYRLNENSALINIGLPIIDITPTNNVSIGAIQYNQVTNTFNIKSPGKSRNTVNILPEYEMIATFLDNTSNDNDVLPSFFATTAIKINSITLPDYKGTKASFKSGATFNQRIEFLSNNLEISITQRCDHLELQKFLDFYNSKQGTLQSFLLPEEFYKFPEVIKARIEKLNVLQRWKFARPPIVSPVVSTTKRGWYQIEIIFSSCIT